MCGDSLEYNGETRNLVFVISRLFVMAPCGRGFRVLPGIVNLTCATFF
jgi:hypothetical protein